MSRSERSQPSIERPPTPFVDDVVARVSRPGQSFHMPGHKQVGLNGGRFRALLGDATFAADLSEMGGLDYLHAPRTSLKAAHELAASTFGAAESFFLINGTTVGNQAAILASVPPGGKVLLPRASHRSVYAAILLADAEPVYVPPVVQPGSALPLATDLAAVAQLLADTPGIAAVHVTSPSYYGFSSDLVAIADLAHAHDVPLIVDEAHGPHFGFHAGFPVSAMEAGADIAVQSTHKTLGSLTQSSMLHVAARYPHVRQLRQALSMLQSSSPSALLLASLDETRALIDERGSEMLSQTLALAAELRTAVNDIPGLQAVAPHVDPVTGVPMSDPSKVLIRVRDLGMTGTAAAEWLLERGIEAELSDLDHILCTVTVADEPESIRALVTCLRALADTASVSTEFPSSQANWPDPPVAALSLRRAFHAASEAVGIEDAIGRVSAEFVIPYPPGIPVLLPGEVIDEPAIAYATQTLERGGRVVGPEDASLGTVRVVSD